MIQHYVILIDDFCTYLTINEIIRLCKHKEERLLLNQSLSICLLLFLFLMRYGDRPQQ